MMAVLPLETGIVYGPVLSRRLGVSLGINVLPTTQKVCSYDCVYCHYGATQMRTAAPARHDFPKVSEVVRAVARALLHPRRLETLTFSGNGEPTLHPQFPTLVTRIRELRDELRPEAKLALFSNSSTITRAEIREALAEIDLPILKLDAGDPYTFEQINRPDAAVRLDSLIEGMRQVRKLVIQSMFIDGPAGTIRGAPFEAWVEAIESVHPTWVQIYSTDYPVPEMGVERVPPYELKRIAAEVTARTGVRVEAYWV